MSLTIVLLLFALDFTQFILRTWNVLKENNQRFQVVPGIGQEYSKTRRARRFVLPQAN